MKLRKLTDQGRVAYLEWLQSRSAFAQPPTYLLDGQDHTELFSDVEIDLGRRFATRYEFGQYAVGILHTYDAMRLLHAQNDGLWDWLTIAYFSQFGTKVSKYWHYTVTRKGHSGSLAYRHLARTAYEMYWRHGDDAVLMLGTSMETWGQLSESLTSRQKIAYHRGYIAAANALYVSNGKVRRGAANRVTPRNKRKPGETKGRGGAERLALAVRRLCLTYDTHTLSTDAMLEILPQEFKNFLKRKTTTSSGA